MKSAIIRSVLAGIQRMVELCEQRGYGWCLSVHGDWANGFDTIGAKIKTTISYPLITGPKRSKRDAANGKKGLQEGENG